MCSEYFMYSGASFAFSVYCMNIKIIIVFLSLCTVDKLGLQCI